VYYGEAAKAQQSTALGESANKEEDYQDNSNAPSIEVNFHRFE